MLNRLQLLSAKLSQLIQLDESGKPKTRYRVLKPYLAGTPFGETKIGAATAAAVNVRRTIPHAEEKVHNPAISNTPKIKKTPLIKPDNRGTPWVTDTTGSPIRPAKGADLVRPTEPYAKVKTRGLILKHQRELQKTVGEAGRTEEAQTQARQKFIKHQRELSGESAKFKDRPHVREAHTQEISNIRSHLAQTGLEGRAIIQQRNKITGSKIQTHEVPEFLKKTRADLDAMVESHVTRKQAERQSVMAGVEGELSKAVTARHIAAGNAVPEPAHVAKVVRSHMAVLHEPTEHTIDTGKHYGHLSDLLGKSHEEIQTIHKKVSDLASEGSEGARALHRQDLIKSGKIFDPGQVQSAYEHVKGSIKKPNVRTDLKKFPILKRAGIAAGVLGAVGAGVAIARHRKKKNEEQQMSALVRIITFGKKPPKKLGAYAEELLRKSNLKKAIDAPSNPLKQLKDIPRELVQRPPWEKVEEHAIKNTEILQSQISKRKKEALGQIHVTHTPEGLKAIESSALRSRGTIGDLTRAKKAVVAAKLGPRGPGAKAQRAVGGYIGKSPELLAPRPKRDFNIDIAAINRDTKTYEAHRKWMASVGKPIGTIRQRRQMVAGKIKKWKVQAKAADLFDEATTGMRQKLEQSEKTISHQSSQLDEIRNAGQDFPHRIERAKVEAAQQADSEAIRNLRGAKQHWEGVVQEQGAKKDREHAAATRKIKRSVNKKIAIGAGAGAATGGAAGYEAGKEKEKKKEARFSAISFGYGDRVVRIAANSGATRLQAAELLALRGFHADRIRQVRSMKLKRVTRRDAASVSQILIPQPKNMTIRVPGDREARILESINRNSTRLNSRSESSIHLSDPTPLQKIRNRIKPDHENTRVHDILTGGAEGAVGILATDPLLKRLHGGAWENPFRGSKKLLGKKLAAGAAVGAVATGLIGAGVSAAAKRRRDRQPIGLSSVDKIISFVVQPANRTAVTRDRYSKKIHVEDMTKAENNYVRTAVGGAAISALLHKRTGFALKPAIAIGAAAGLGAQAFVRSRTAKTKDQFGDRSYAAKRIDNAPGQAAILAAGGLAAHKAAVGSAPYREALKKVGRGIKRVAQYTGVLKMSVPGGKIITFDDGYEITGSGLTKRTRRSKEAIAIERYGTYAKRGGRLARDIKAKVQGKQVLDSRGREKTKEWDRPWVRTAATGLIIGGTGLGVAGVKRATGSTAVNSEVGKLVSHLQTGSASKAAGNFVKAKVPGVAKAVETINKVRGRGADEIASVAESSSVLGKINKGIEKYSKMEHKPKFIETPAEGGGITRHYQGSEGYAKIMQRKMSDVEKVKHVAERSAVSKIESAAHSKPVLSIMDWLKKRRFASTIRAIRFAEAPGQYDDNWEDWLRSRPGVAKRIRRQKTIFEKEENKKVVNRAKIGAALVAGTAIGATFRRPSPDLIKRIRTNRFVNLSALADRLLVV